MKLNTTIEVGRQYKINGSVYTVTGEVEIPPYPEFEKFGKSLFTIVSQTNRKRRIAVRYDGSAFTYRSSPGSSAEVTQFEAL